MFKMGVGKPMVFPMGFTGSGMVLIFGTLQHIVHPYCGVTGINGFISRLILFFLKF